MAWDLLRPLAIVSTSALALLAVVRNKSCVRPLVRGGRTSLPQPTDPLRHLRRQQARYYINLALYIGTLLTTSILALGISVFLACIGQVSASACPCSSDARHLKALVRLTQNLVPLPASQHELHHRAHVLQAVLALDRPQDRCPGRGAPQGRRRTCRDGRQPPEVRLPLSWTVSCAGSACGLTLELGRDHPSSFIDILYLGKIFPKRASIMAKKELSWTPFLGWWSESSSSLLFPMTPSS